MNSITRFDPSALNRAFIGFDRLFNDIEKRFANSAHASYPPFNIIQHDENSYEIQIAVSGFNREDVSVEIDQNMLRITGVRSKDAEVDASKYIHRGLAARDFERVFTIADHMEVVGAEMLNGVLNVQIRRIVPEELKPRQIEIK